MKNKKYSVLMSVYKNEKATYFDESIRSMLNQSIKPDEIVIVKDGPLTVELEQIISKYRKFDLFKIISLDTNQGLGRALNIGLVNCKNEFIARMDTDDISVENRCEKQINMLIKNDCLSVIGSAVEEFVGRVENVVAYKTAVKGAEDIRRKMKYRNALNHPTVMYRKEAVLKAGSYKDWLLNEDY